MEKYFQKVRNTLGNYKIGLRTIKTAVAVFLCLLIQLIAPMDTVLYAAIAAVVCMRETAEKSLHMGIHRFIGTVVGGVFGFVLLKAAIHIPYYYEGLYIIVVPIGMVFCISACIWLRKKDAVIICCVVFLSIALDLNLNTDATVSYVVWRVIDTTVGVIIATLLNRYFFPYDGDDKNK